ncbi:Transcription initiation factor TFIID subunit 11 [Smittium culicis]|uniref:Transcription initiation factor TFIID subunit 11 n=1 Tax=Smittium culicis TaxID=133412 RepID=A0A1R1XWV6_9FUNG|nr:Transcription initiation factor TFIID subunit 11 [Smittium culicis]
MNNSDSKPPGSSPNASSTPKTSESSKLNANSNAKPSLPSSTPLAQNPLAKGLAGFRNSIRSSRFSKLDPINKGISAARNFSSHPSPSGRGRPGSSGRGGRGRGRGRGRGSSNAMSGSTSKSVFVKTTKTITLTGLAPPPVIVKKKLMFVDNRPVISNSNSRVRTPKISVIAAPNPTPGSSKKAAYYGQISHHSNSLKVPGSNSSASRNLSPSSKLSNNSGSISDFSKSSNSHYGSSNQNTSSNLDPRSRINDNLNMLSSDVDSDSSMIDSKRLKSKSKTIIGTDDSPPDENMDQDLDPNESRSYTYSVDEQFNIKKQSKQEIKEILDLFDSEQHQRYEVYRRTGLNKSSIKKLCSSILNQQISQTVSFVIAGFGKIFVGEIVELAIMIKNEQGQHDLPIQPNHLIEAYRRYNLRNESDF